MGYYRTEANRAQGVGPNQSPAWDRQPAGGYGGLAGAGFWMQIGGAVLGAIGTYYQAKARQDELKSQALSLDFQQSMDALNARQAANDADAIMQSAERQIGLQGMQYAQERAAMRTSTAARGVMVGTGSAAEGQASLDYAEQSDRMTISANATRAAGNARLQSVGLRNRGLLAGVSAGNLRASARGINPGLQLGTSLLGNSGRIAGQAVYNGRY